MVNIQEKVVLVDEKDTFLGEMEKLEAHKKGLLHRAFSVFIYNDKNEILLQQRAANKYHSPNQWTNACCSHPKKNESYQQAAERRVYEELGIQLSLQPKFYFIYKSNVGNGLIEHELDHVFEGKYNQSFTLNPQEVQAIKWVSKQDLLVDIQNNPNLYTPWFKIILNQYLKKLS